MVMMNKALTRICQSLKRRKIDALLVTQPENRRYLSGFTATDHSISETSGILLIPTSGSPHLLTDSRYQLQAESEAEGFEVQLYPRGMFTLLRKLLSKLKIRRLAFESHYLLHSTSVLLGKLAEKKGIELVSTTGMVENLRIQKNDEELAKIKRSVLLNEAVFQEIYKGLRPGQAERDVALKIENAMRIKGADGPSFDTIVAGGANGAMPHAVPTNRPLQEGEPIIIDMGLRLSGYCSDMTRTIVLGSPDNQTISLFRLVRKAQLAGIKSLRAGMTGQAVDKIARDIISQAGLGERFGHGLGHGVGLAVHESPAINWRNRKQLRPGMVVTIEPGVYIPGWGGIRLENMAVVREDGCEILNEDSTFLDL